MKIKPVGKILIVAILAVIGFFGIKKYQTTHPSPTVAAVDTTAKHPIDSVALAIKKDSPITEHSEIVSKKKVVPEHIAKSKPEHKTNEKKDKDGRKNLDLSNF